MVGLLLGLIGHEGVVMWFRCLRLSVLVLLVGACAPVEVPHQPVSPVSTIVPTILVTAPVSPSASESVAVSGDPSPSPSDADLAAAEALVKEYFRLKGEVRKDPNFDIGLLEAVVAGPVLEQEVPILKGYQEKNYRQVGDFTSTLRGSSKLDADTVQVLVCTDTNGSDIIDSSTGNSILDPDRSRTRMHNLTVKRYDGAWKVFIYADEAVETCAG